MTTFKDTIDHMNQLAADVDRTLALEPGTRSRQRELLQQEFIKLKAMMAKYVSQFMAPDDTNTKDLEGMMCPHCKSLEPFDIICEGWMLVYDDPEQGDHQPRDTDWHEDSECVCVECKYVGKVSDFRSPYWNATGTKPVTASREDVNALLKEAGEYWNRKDPAIAKALPKEAIDGYRQRSARPNSNN